MCVFVFRKFLMNKAMECHIQAAALTHFRKYPGVMDYFFFLISMCNVCSNSISFGQAKHFGYFL